MSPMPAGSDAFRNSLLMLQRQQRAEMTRLIEQTEASLAADWQRGPAIVAQYYAPLIDEYARALADLRATEDNPAATLSMDWLTSRNPQLAAIEQNVRASLDQYGHDAQQAVTAAQSGAINQGFSDAAQLTQRSLWPAVEGAGVPPSMLFNRPNPDAISAWMGRSGNGHPLGDLFSNFGAEAATSARKEMLLGLATGANPRAMAAGIANALGISRSRATIIARTEVLGSYRTAAMETYRANSDVVNGWIWSAGGQNPCAACMGQDGLQFSLEEELIDHPCGACAAIPITKSWDDILGPLGIDSSGIDETSMGEEGAYLGGEERFAQMSEAQQRAVIGTKTGYEAYQRGEVTLRDFAARRADGMLYQRSLRELQIPTRQASRLVEQSPELRAMRAAGKLRYTDYGKVTPLEQMPAWARQSEASRNVYQILRNGLPYDLMSHEQGLLITNLEQMLREELPVNVRAAVERQLQFMGQQVERQTVGEAARLAAADEATLAREVQIAAKFNLEPLSAEALARESQRIDSLIRTTMDEEHFFKNPALAARLEGNADFASIREKIAQDYRDYGFTEAQIVERIPDTTEGLVGAVLSSWGAGDEEFIAAAQQAIQDEFGLTGVAKAGADAAAWADYQPGLRALVREMYNNTQDYLRANSITEIPAFRGMAFDRLPKGFDAALLDRNIHEITLSMRAGSSFAADADIARQFSALAGEKYGMALAARIPGELILSLPQTGFGLYGQSEVVVLGGEHPMLLLGDRLSRERLTMDEIIRMLIDGKGVNGP